MAQTGFVLSDEGRTLSVLNDSGTTAIEAGDLVFTETVDDQLGGTAASARSLYAAGGVKVKSCTDNATGYLTVLGIAMEDIPADGYGAIAMEGVFLHAVNADTEAGDVLQAVASTNYVTVLAAPTTTPLKADIQNTIGRALNGGTTQGEYIVWKLCL